MPPGSAGRDNRVVNWGYMAAVDTQGDGVLSWRGCGSDVAGHGGPGCGAARDRRIGRPEQWPAGRSPILMAVNG